MHSILLQLEPCQYPKYATIVGELDEFGEITFIDNGIIGIGFEINK